MKIYIKGLLICYLAIFTFSAYDAKAQKVIDSSRKKRPEWVGGAIKGALIVSAVSDNLENAKLKCLSDIKVQMLESVAQNIEYSSRIVVDQLTQGHNVQSNISYHQEGGTNVANLPFLTGISMASAEDFYWEKFLDSKTNHTYYCFNLLYPYNDADYQMLKSEFDIMDGKMVSTVEGCETDLNKFGSIEELEDRFSKLLLAKDYFFDKKRSAWVDNVINSYMNCYSGLTVCSKNIEKGKIQCWIQSTGKLLSCTTLPSIKSECASRIECTSDGRIYTITYSDEYCIDDADNSLELCFKFRYYTLKHKLFY